MPQRKRSGTFKSAPKVFRCAGFGNCDMVFTRSEHLARHQRKHTGEKPYKCIVQGCGRMFSRFDNMMQHTQTHEKHKKRISHSPEKKESDNSSQSSATDPSSPIDMDGWMYRKNSMPDLVNPLPFEHSMVKNRILPPPRRASISVLSSYNSCPLPLSQVASSPMQMYPSQETPSLFTPGNRFSWPIYQRQSEENYYGSHPLMCDSYNRRSSTSTHSTDSGHSISSYSQQSFGSLSDPPIRRRISIDDLRTPIEEFKSIKLESSPKHNQAASVDITSDEYEALEGFSKFSKQPFISNKKSEDLYHINPAYQVCAIRQRLMSLKESFQRPIRYTEN